MSAVILRGLHLFETKEYSSVQPVITIVTTEPPHLRELVDNLRQEDENEIVAFGITPHKALWRSYKNSLFAKTAFIDGKVAACWGVCGKFMGTKGQSWLLTSNEVKKISPLKFTRIYQQEVKKMLELFPVLENWVDSEYSAAMRLLTIVGFSLGEPEPLGKHGHMYRKFYMEAV